MVIWVDLINMTIINSKVSELQLYFGDPYQVTEKIQVLQPTIGGILEYDKQFGESEFWSMLNVFIGNTTTYRLMLWEMGVDWNKISDFQLFSLLVKTLDIDHTRILFGDIDLSQMDVYTKTIPIEDIENTEEEVEPKQELILWNSELDIEIDENVYNNITLYLRTMFNIFPKVEKARGKETKKWIIEEDKRNLANAKKEETTSTFLPLIESCCCHPGFKYKKNELREVGIYEFMRSVQRLQVYESTTALLKGMYSGFIDTKGIDKEEFDFMREIKPVKNKYEKLK